MTVNQQGQDKSQNLFHSSGEEKFEQCSFFDTLDDKNPPVSKARKKQAKSAAEKYRAMLMLTSDVTYRMSPDWSTMIELHGRGFLSDTQKPDPHWLDRYIRPLDQPYVIESIQEAIRTKSVFKLEHRVLRADGNIGWTYSCAVPIMNGQDEIIEWLGIANDITNRKQAESKINRQNTVLNAINHVYQKSVSCKTLEQLGCACLEIIESATNSTISFIGEIGEDGVFRDIAVGESGWGLCSMYDQTGHRKPPRDFPIRGLYGSVLKTGKTLMTNEPAGHPDSIGVPEGHPPVHSFLGVPFLSDGKVIGMVAAANRAKGYTDEDKEMLEALTPTILEVLLRKRTEEALRISRTEIEKRDQYLQHSEKRALELVDELRQTDRNKNEFINMMSHELRNPLATIVAGLSLLDISTDDQQIKRAEDIVRRQIDHLCRLVDDLLDLSRITQNRIALKKDRVELTALSTLLADDHRVLFEEKGVGLGTQITKEPLYLEADPARVRQAIGNLLHNTLKFTDRGGEAWLHVGRDGSDAVVCVVDNGPGIEPGILPELFKPFVQGENTLDRTSGGLGLGLAVVKGIAEMHGGSVSAFSEGIGKGARFTLRLPLFPLHSEKPASDAPDGIDSRNMRILVIEDNRDFAEMLCSMLAQLGHETATAHDGLQGVATAREMRPDIVFCDIGLPGMNGYEVAEAVRRDKDLKDVCLIALTGYAQEQDRIRAIESGFDKHMAKPVAMPALWEVLSEVSRKN
jgi:signal transduction histidine kinase